MLDPECDVTVSAINMTVLMDTDRVQVLANVVVALAGLPVSPSNGKITFDEFDATALEDLLTFSIADESAPVVDVADEVLAAAPQ